MKQEIFDEEKERHMIEKNNSDLVLKPEFLTINYEMLHSWYSWYECAIFWFIKFFLSNNDRFYCSDEQLAEMLNIGERTISAAIRKLQKNWLIKCKTNIRSGWWKIRFIELQKTTVQNRKNCASESQNTRLYIIDNNIIEDNISNSNELDDISSPQEKNLSFTKISSLSWPQPLGPLSPEADHFIKHSYHTFPSIKYQMDKNPQKYLEDLFKDYDKLCKEYGKETVDTVLNYIKQDDFWSKQIQSIGKLRKKNKDWVPYIVVMIEKIQQYKPKIIDLDE